MWPTHCRFQRPPSRTAKPAKPGPFLGLFRYENPRFLALGMINLPWITIHVVIGCNWHFFIVRSTPVRYHEIALFLGRTWPRPTSWPFIHFVDGSWWGWMELFTQAHAHMYKDIALIYKGIHVPVHCQAVWVMHSPSKWDKLKHTNHTHTR